MRLNKIVAILSFHLVLVFGCIPRLIAHDTWVEAGPLVQATGEYTYVNLMLGNHGNEHRDFKLASKVTLTHCTLECTGPAGTITDLKPRIIDMGYAAKEGYWAARYEFAETGVHEFLHTLDTLHGTIRAVKSAKTYVIAYNPSEQSYGKALHIPKPRGLGLELQLQSKLEQLCSGRELQIQVLRSGKPLPNARVTFVPRGVVLAEGMDPKHERMSDVDGMVRYSPEQGNILLAIVHHVDATESGEGYDRTHYGAALVLPIRNNPITSGNTQSVE